MASQTVTGGDSRARSVVMLVALAVVLGGAVILWTLVEDEVRNALIPSRESPSRATAQRPARKSPPPARGRAGASPSWLPQGIRLSAEAPLMVTGLPALRGRSQRYGVLRLGVSERPTFGFVLDVPGNGSPSLYLDRNRNGDLSDGGEPLGNRGTGPFATRIVFPIEDVIPGLAGGQTQGFEIWFFSNESLWKDQRATFYSRSAMRGQVWFDGRERLVYVTESGRNDGDFTNDGVQIDLDGDGKVSNKERIMPGQEIERGGRRYRFEVRW